jgi:RHS repeat-associated protein
MNPRADLRRLATAVGMLLALTTVQAAAPNKSGTGKASISLPSGPGSVEGMGGSFEPQLNSGTVTYAVTLPVPAGRAGLTPSISLSYEGGRGNGVCGFGWGVGAGSIRRQSDKGYPRHDAADTFLLGGEELVPLSNPEQDWRCENDRSFQRIRQVPGRSAWEVTNPDGSRHHYGGHRGEGGRFSAVMNPSARGTDFDRTYLWLLESTVDVHGNRIEYEYEPGEGTLYLGRITWSHWVHDGLTNHYEARFAYETRPDVFDDFRPGFTVRTDRRLARVDMNVVTGGVSRLVRAFRLDYAYAPEDLVASDPDTIDTGVSMLRRVMFFGSDGNTNNYLPPTLFGYTPLKLGTSRLQALDPAPELNLAEERGNVQLTDVDGDGLPDLFQTTDFDQRFQLNRGEWARDGRAPALAFDPVVVRPRAPSMQLSNPESALMDFDGDGLVDFVQLTDSLFGGREMETFRNASSLARRSTPPGGFSDGVETSVNLPAGLSLTNLATRQADVNFDKLTDFVTTEPGFFGRFILAYRDTDGRWQRLETDYPDDMPPALTFAWNGASNTPAVHLADLNGDRIQDIVLVERDGPSLRTRYWPGTGLGTWGTGREVGTFSPDVLAAEIADLRDVYVQDLTGDGLADLLMVDGSSDPSRIVLRVNVTGDHWSSPVERGGLPRYRPRDDAASTTFRLVDLNGNGSTDLLWVNPGFNPGWQWLELMPEEKANLIRWTDNGIGRLTEITYGTSTEDLVRAREAGYPWQTTTPFAVPVIRRLRITPSLDLDGISDSGRPVSTDQHVSEFQYRDAYYDPFEKEFRGFAFAQKTDYGDDFLMDTNLVTMAPSQGWDRSRSPSGQVGAPSLVTRLRFHTGAPDGVDNDEYPPGFSGARYVDEVTPHGGREEDPLKGVQVAQEMVDGWVLHGGAPLAGFDRGCFLAVTSTNADGAARMTPDDFVYGRVFHEWAVRRLYRSGLPQAFTAWAGDGDRAFDEVLTPAGRFSGRIPAVGALPESGRTVSQVFIRRIEGFQFEANGMFRGALSFPERPPTHSLQVIDQDDYGNEVRVEHWGFVDDASTDDERFVLTRFALDGEALERWIVRMPAESTTTDENGVFVNRTRHYYDGPDFTGLPLGQVGARGLETRTEQFINGDTPAPALETASDRPGDPRLPVGASVNSARAAFDASGNLRQTLDPLGDPARPEAGHAMRFAYDADLNMFCTEERTLVGGGLPDHVVTARYDVRYGVVTAATNVNGHGSSWGYDAFGRLVSAVRPGDTAGFPTLRYEYLPGDPLRNRVYRYDPAGNLSTVAAERPATRIVSRQREQHGDAGEFVSVGYQDGLMREIAVVHEGDFGGHWIVHKASTFTHRSGAATSWLPYDFIAGTSDATVPDLADFWRDGRPLQESRDGTVVAGTRVLSDALGRELLFVNAPESSPAGQAAPPPLVRRTWRLPREQMVFDEEDTSAASPHSGTPLTARLDGLGRVVEQVESAHLDDEGRRTNSVVAWTTRYWFDLNDQVVRTRDSQGNETRFRHDALGRNIYLNDPDRGPMSMVYDDASNHTETRDAKGQRIAYRHDGHNRLAAIDYLDDGDPVFGYRKSPEVEFHYDVSTHSVPQGDGTRATPENVVDKLVWASDTAGAVHFSYDARGRVAWQVREIDHPAGLGRIPFRMAWDYDAFDRTVRTVFPDNDEYRTQFGPRNLIRSLRGSLLTVVSNIDYAVSGKMSRIAYGNGVVTEMAYDPRLRLDRLQTRTPAGGPVVNYQYGYDGISNVREIRDLRPASVRPSGNALRNSQSFEYDDLYRLSAASYSLAASGTGTTPDGQIRYRYDRIGNLLEQRATGVAASGNTRSDTGRMGYGGAAGPRNRTGRDTAEPGPHALTAAEEAGFRIEYDRNGNVTRLAGTRLAWDFEDRLVEADNGSELASYRYSLENVRLSRHVRPKPGASNAGPEEIVLYPFPGYEVRPGNSAEKLIALPGLPLARVAASLSRTPRVQRLELQPGWNLVSVALTVTNLESQLESVITPGTPVLRADTADGAPASLPGTVSPGPAAYWVHARSASVAPVVGAAPEPSARPLQEGGTFLATTAPGRWRIPEEVRTNAVIWRLGGDGWATAPGALAAGVADDGWVEGGEAVFVRLAAASSLPPLAGKVAFFHCDHLGSTAVMTDEHGRRIEEATWFPFGGERSRESLTDQPEPFGFSGHENDRETGLTYMTARYQSPEYARFLSVDPKLAADPKSRLREPQGLNFYAYALNNPLSWRDPSGCDVELDPQMEAMRLDMAQRMHVDPGNPFQVAGMAPEPASADTAPGWLQGALGSGNGGETQIGSVGGVSISAQSGQFEGEAMVGAWLGNKDTLSFENAVTLKRSSKGTEVCGHSGGVIQDAKYVFTLAKACHNFTTGENTFRMLELQREPKMDHRGNKSLFANGVVTVKGFRPQVHFNMKESSMRHGDKSGMSTGDFSITAGVQGGGEVSVGLGAGIIKPVTVTGTVKGVVAVEIRKKGTETTAAVLFRGEGEVKVVISLPSAGGLVNFPVVLNGKGETRVIFRHNSGR